MWIREENRRRRRGRPVRRAMEDDTDATSGDGGGDVGVDSGGGGGGGGGNGNANGGNNGGEEQGLEQLSAVARLKQLALSKTGYERLMTGRVLEEIFRSAVDYMTELPIDEIMEPVQSIIKDSEVTVRSDLIEMLPRVAMICQEAPGLFPNFVSHHLLGIVLKYLRDSDNQVRQAAQAALLALLERHLLDKDSIEHVVCPVLMELSHQEVEFIISSIALMSKMALLVGREFTERVFLDRYVVLCSHVKFLARKACAIHIGGFCAAVGREVVELVLLPKFIQLCKDDVWGVRKACAEVIVSVSYHVSLAQRRSILAPIFATFLKDDSRWVRISAFQMLGPFISAFANHFTGLKYNQCGELVFTNQQGAELRISYSPSVMDESCQPTMHQPCDEDEEEEEEEEEEDTREKPRQTVIIQNQSSPSEEVSIDVCMANTRYQKSFRSRRKVDKSQHWSDPRSDLQPATELDKFNPFLYYYVSPDLPLDLDLLRAWKPNRDPKPRWKTNAGSKKSAEEERKKSEKGDDAAKAKEEDPKPTNRSEEENPASEEENDSIGPQDTSEVLNDTVDIGNVSVDKNLTFKIVTPMEVKLDDMSQNVVPRILIDFFASMADSTQTGELGVDVSHHCAFTFPAVMLTLGKKNWPLLRHAYYSLANAMPWKVRRTLASGIHEIAKILGEELTASDLLPIYDGFIKDLDEVRVGALEHLATFLKVLSPKKRTEYLPRLNDLLVPDNQWNWRFREELTKQLLEIVSLLDPYDVAHDIAYLAYHLLVDNVAAVRHAAISLVTHILYYLSDDRDLGTKVIHELWDLLINHPEKWTRRQTYALVCADLLETTAITEEMFVKEMLPHLMKLSMDTVPNVRLVVARTLATQVCNICPVVLLEKDAYAVRERILLLRKDPDRDVRVLAGGCE
ncbi:serine/threonine-protein phosphatase 4 regulatory subunit 1 isoform X2 [Orussus abietinus]|uniref:serine/threonine-protein phosphatase 4 regulatory subunit 1 isoform X2 n=1 Tax=Orussus abietinus TaxID=222816 RepID=UPI000625E7F2|nr:serine/threonine-protein phosphatase 4 regulatory subunit 1 isoform X2 [Orussus abietinus]